jgi:hypothetical protein
MRLKMAAAGLCWLMSGWAVLAQADVAAPQITGSGDPVLDKLRAEELWEIPDDITAGSFHGIPEDHPLLVALKQKNMSMLKSWLSEHDVNEPVGTTTALILTTVFGNDDMVSALTAAGAQTEGVDQYGRTALHYAAMLGEMTKAKLLLSLGANPNFRDKRDVTPLYSAYFHQRKAMASLLHEAGGDVNLIDAAGNMLAFRVAEQLNDPETGKQMIRHGLNLMRRNQEDMTLFEVAYANSNTRLSMAWQEEYKRQLEAYRKRLMESRKTEEALKEALQKQ